MPNAPPPSFLRRRESIGGIRFVWMVLKIFVARFLLLKIRFLSQPVLMNVRMAVVRQKFMPHPATYPLSRLAGEGWGEGGFMSCTNLFSPQKHKTTPILTFPRQTGEGTKLLIRQRGRLKTGIYEFQTTAFIIRPRRIHCRRHSRAGGNPLVGLGLFG